MLDRKTLDKKYPSYSTAERELKEMFCNNYALNKGLLIQYMELRAAITENELKIHAFIEKADGKFKIKEKTTFKHDSAYPSWKECIIVGNEADIPTELNTLITILNEQFNFYKIVDERLIDRCQFRGVDTVLYNEYVGAKMLDETKRHDAFLMLRVGMDQYVVYGTDAICSSSVFWH